MNSSHYQGVLVPYRHYIGRSEHEIKQVILNKHADSNVDPIDRDFTTQLNSTFLEVVDKAYYWRGMTSFIGAGFCIAILVVAFLSLQTILNRFDIFEFLYLLFLVGLFVFMYYCTLRNDLIGGYTHYPIRFNRKNRQVYVFKNKNNIEVYHWDTLKVAVTNLGTKEDYDLRFYETDAEGKISRAFSFPYINKFTINQNGNKWTFAHENLSCDVLCAWEYVRQYMDGDLATVHGAVRHKLWVHKKRPSLFETARIAWLFIPKGYNIVKKDGRWVDDPQKTYILNAGADIVQAVAFTLILMGFFGQLILNYVAKKPVWPQWVEQDCVIDANDPFDYDKHPNKGHPKPQKTLFGIFLRTITVAICYVSLYGCVWIIEAMMVSKSGSQLGFSLLHYMSFWRWF